MHNQINQLSATHIAAILGTLYSAKIEKQQGMTIQNAAWLLSDENANVVNYDADPDETVYPVCVPFALIAHYQKHPLKPVAAIKACMGARGALHSDLYLSDAYLMVSALFDEAIKQLPLFDFHPYEITENTEALA